MRTWSLSLLAVAATLCVPATASAAFEHVVAPGESLSSVAAADGLSVGQLAAANGLSPNAELVAGTALAIPPQTGVTVAGAPTQAAAEAAPTQDASSEVAPGAAGGYLVQPGDTLTAIATRYGTTVDQLAAANGLNPDGVLLAGASLSIDGSASAPTESTAAAPDAAGGAQPTESTAAAPDAAGGAQPTEETVSPSDVGSIAAQNGVSPSLAEAIADQESGFNNAEVSSTGATGVMQIEPGTWSYINSLGGPSLSPDSASDNVLGGVELLHSLLDQTGGDPALAAAGYYQGLASVRAHGLYSDTQSYVNNVMALEGRFGG